MGLETAQGGEPAALPPRSRVQFPARVRKLITAVPPDPATQGPLLASMGTVTHTFRQKTHTHKIKSIKKRKCFANLCVFV